MKVISVTQSPEYINAAISYFQKIWAKPETMDVYSDCIAHSVSEDAPLPRWYLLLDGADIIGCAGLITNDFISRMDLYPWLCALYIEPGHRGRNLGALLIEKAESDAKAGGFFNLYLCTDHVGYYERYGFSFVGIGFHPWGESSRIYSKPL